MKPLIAFLGVVLALLFMLSASAVLAQDACEGNFDCDQDCDGSDAVLFKIDFGRSEYNRPCTYMDICNGDFDCDGDSDGANAALFVLDFGRSEYNNACPPCSTSVLLAETGQSTSHHDDDDGHYEMGVSWPNPRFTDKGDGTVIDNLTGLMWTKDTHPSGGYEMPWQEAIDYVQSMNTGTNPNFDHTDWRVPNIKELLSLVDYGEFCPALPLEHPFVNVQNYSSRRYWSNTTRISDDGQAWSVCIFNGEVDCDTKESSNLYLWPVRGGFINSCNSPYFTAQLASTGQANCYNIADEAIDCVGTGQDGEYQMGVAWPDPRFTDHGDGTVTDALTGLMWPKERPFQLGTNWYAALVDCSYLEFAGYSDWRIPNMVELLSLVDYSQSFPALPSGHPFVNLGETGYYWSSTFSEECCDPDDQAWYVHLGTGLTGIDETGWGLKYVLPVRGSE